MLSPVVVEFPLRGEWFTPNTPGTRIPSHGTDVLGQRYAYDFVGLEPGSSRRRYYRATLLRYLALGVRLEEFFGWGQPIFSATAGTVVRAEDGWPERNPVHLVTDVAVMLKNSRLARAGKLVDLRSVTGNSVIVEAREGYVVYAHAQTGSIMVSPGDKVSPGQQLARVGHSGNSTAPHLHFQLMDQLEVWKAQGVACCFRSYEVREGNTWRTVENGIPKATERLRKL